MCQVEIQRLTSSLSSSRTCRLRRRCSRHRPFLDRTRACRPTRECAARSSEVDAARTLGALCAPQAQTSCEGELWCQARAIRGPKYENTAAASACAGPQHKVAAKTDDKNGLDHQLRPCLRVAHALRACHVDKRKRKSLPAGDVYGTR